MTQTMTRALSTRTVSAPNFARNLSGLTPEEIRVAAPSVFADGPWQGDEEHKGVSKSYLFTPTIRGLDRLMDRGLIVTQVQQSRTRIPGKSDFTRHQIWLRQDLDAGRTLSVGDTFFQAVLENSHDKTSSWKLWSALLRLQCLNGQTAKVREGRDMRYQHSLRNERNIVDSTLYILEEEEEAMQEVEMLQSVQFSRQEQLLLAKHALAVRWDLDPELSAEQLATQTLYRPEDYLKRRRYSGDEGTDAWTLLNVVEENARLGGSYIQRYDDKGNLHSPREVKSIDGQNRIRRTLKAVVQEMAAIKLGQ